MMMNLFIMFDPSTNLFSFNWIALILPYFLMFKSYYVSNSRISIIYFNLKFFIFSDIKNNISLNYQKIMILLISIFLLIMTSNLLSLLPFIFTPTSHMSLSLFLSLPLWITFMLKGYISNFSFMLTHLIPLNTPIFLCPFMVIIETISNLIRPLTLSIRLTANMIAGHILISLLSNTLNNNFIIFMMNSFILNTLMILEISVSMIQGYVFITLISLYLDEIPMFSMN